MAAALATPDPNSAAELASGDGGDSAEAAKDPLRGYVGWVYEDLFEELYAAAAPPAPAAEAALEAAEDDGEGDDSSSPEGGQARDLTADVDCSEEDGEIAAIEALLEKEQGRIGRVLDYIQEQQDEAGRLEKEDADLLMKKWGLTIREQVPVPESHLRTLLDSRTLAKEGLIVPHHVLLDLEKKIAIETGLEQQHENLLSVSKPAEPNHLRSTASNRCRYQSRNIRPVLNEAQRRLLAKSLAERRQKRPPMPPTLNAEEKEKNREILRRMLEKVSFLRNPRFVVDQAAAQQGGPCPFRITPAQVVFRNYDVGCIYDISVEFRNVTNVGRRLRVIPCASEVFSVAALTYECDKGRRPDEGCSSVVAPGMAAHLKVCFAPQTLNDQDEVLKVCTELGDYALPVLSRRVQPSLDFEEPVNCGCILAGRTAERSVRITNNGGEGSFRFVSGGGEATSRYDTDPHDVTTFICGNFSLRPASFYLEADDSVDVTVIFSAPEVGPHELPVFIEGDNGQMTKVTLKAITDALRLELLRWPTLPDHKVRPRSSDPGSSPWNLVPWQIGFLAPGVQVGRQESREVVLSNGGYLPMDVSWHLAVPPKAILSRLAVGGVQRLTDDIVEQVHHWENHARTAHGSANCPFQVSPISAVIPPFSTASFTFTFSPFPPVGHRATAFAYASVENLPASGHCLLPFERLLSLQSTMQPDDYERGMPLFGNVLFGHKAPKDSASANKPSQPEVANCVATAICLQGIGTAPSVSCMPPLVAFAGHVLPYVAHTREILLRNNGHFPARFRVRPTSAGLAERATDRDDCFEVLQVLDPTEARERLDASLEVDPEASELRRTAETLLKQWPPLPPEPLEAAELGPPGTGQPSGAGALASLVVEPSFGVVAAGQTVKLRVTLRAGRESDIDSCFFVELPTSEKGEDESPVPPLRVRVSAAVRAPRPQLPGVSLIDFGVVRAHAMHTLSVRVQNPSAMPTLVRLEHSKDGSAGSRVADKMHGRFVPEPGKPFMEGFPMRSHSEVVNAYAQAAFQGPEAVAKLSASRDLPPEAEPWVHAQSGCIDRSGRKSYTSDSVGDEPEANDDFRIVPEWALVPPFGDTEIQVTFRAGRVQRYNSFLQLIGFDSLYYRCIEVLAQVQLPQVCFSSQHVHYPVTFSRTLSEPRSLQLQNTSDMRSSFQIKMPSSLETGLEVQIEPSSGIVEPRASLQLRVVVTPTSVSERSEAVCHALIADVIQPLQLRVSAKVYGLEVDYAVVADGQLAPQIEHRPRFVAPSNTREVASVEGARPPRTAPKIDFGEVALQDAKSLRLVLYNRSGIATPFAVRVQRYPAFDPDADKSTVGSTLRGMTKLSKRSSCDKGTLSQEPQSHVNEPLPAANLTRKHGSTGSRHGSKGASGHDGGRHQGTGDGHTRRRLLLDDKHEQQAFRGASGAEFAEQKRRKEQGNAALNTGRGYALKLEPSHDWLQPFGSCSVTCTCFSDIPGEMEDELILTIQSLDPPEFRIPIRLKSCGNPLFLPDQQVALNMRYAPPKLSMGTIVPAERMATRSFKVSNSSSTGIKVGWKVYLRKQIEDMSEQRQFVSIALCPKKSPPGVEEEDEEEEDLDEEDQEGEGKSASHFAADPEHTLPFGFQMWANEPPPIHDPYALPSGDPPVRIDPPESVLPPRGVGQFSVAMEGTKAMSTAAGHYRYKLVGKGRYASSTERPSSKSSESARTRPTVEKKVITRDGGVVPPRVGSVEEVTQLPDIKLEELDLYEEDSDREEVEPNTQPVARQNSIEHTGSRRASIEAHEEQAQVLPHQVQDVNMNKLRRWTTKEIEHENAFEASMLEEPDVDVMSTLVIDSSGDCILPRLTVDKNVDPLIQEHECRVVTDENGTTPDKPLNCPVFKFTHCTVAGMAPSRDVKARPGAGFAAVPGGSRDAGTGSLLMRQVTLTNNHACNVACRFRVEGPFAVREVAQVGKSVARPPPEEQPSKRIARSKVAEAPVDPVKEEFTVGRNQTVTVTIEFKPEEWKAHERAHDTTVIHCDGDLFVEYPREAEPEGGGQVKLDIQRIHLAGTVRRPAVSVVVIPMPHLDPPKQLRADEPEWGEKPPELIEFGCVHVDAGVTRKRCVLLFNDTSVVARWKLLHVGRKTRKPLDIGSTTREVEERQALDDKDAFSFDISEGEISGPSKGGKTYGLSIEEKRMPRWYPQTPALPTALPHHDDWRFEPMKITIAFKPKKNELYRCRFRLQVEGGRGVDFLCRGCGSYDEEDDVTEVIEA